MTYPNEADRYLAWQASAVSRARAAGPGEGHDDGCESEFVEGAMAWSPCQCEERAIHRAHDDRCDAPAGGGCTCTYWERYDEDRSGILDGFEDNETCDCHVDGSACWCDEELTT